MNLYFDLRNRLKSRSDSEHEQAILRMVIVAVVLIYMGLTYEPRSDAGGHSEILLVQGLAADLIFAAGLFIAICIHPPVNVSRRYIGMLSDAGAATFCMYLAGEAGVSMLGVYLFITFGNGFRYGRRYLFACQALCLAGFTGVLMFAPYWERHQVAGWGLMIAMIVLPLYVSTLLKRIHEARSRAEEANRAKSAFLANMSHEMRTPLNGIVGVVDLMQTKSLNGEQLELMQLLRHSVSILRSLVDDVLDISKIEAGRLNIETVDFDLHALLNGLVRLLRPHASSKGLRLHLLVDPTLEYELRGDPHHLRQVLLNLISNALKFTAKGEIQVAVTPISATSKARTVRFEVRDTGIGISEEAQDRIFDEFVQADNSTTRRYGGSGLGTTIAKQLVELMGGKIGLRSQVGVGSTFWFELPLQLSSSSVATAEIAEDPREGAVEAVLAIDGTDDVLERGRRLLELSGCVVRDVLTFEQARRWITAEGRNGAARVFAVAGDHARSMDLLREGASLRVALIYLSDAELTVEQAAEVRQLDGGSAISLSAAPRVLTNAIHAATVHEYRGGAEVIDLGAVLKQQRQSVRVLVAEDNSTNQLIIRQLLESAGHRVVLASDGDEALDLYEAESPDLAILDFNMPERSGTEVASAIRVMEPTGARLPIIILSASVTPEARERAKQAGADEFVGKPFDATQLLQAVDRLARTHGHRNTTATAGYARSASVLHGAMPLVDRSRVADLERISSSADFVDRLLRGFHEDVCGLMGRLEHAVSNRDLNEVHDLAHAIKGAALGVGAQQLAARAGAMDVAAKAGQVVTSVSVDEMMSCFEATTKQLDVYSVERRRKSM